MRSEIMNPLSLPAEYYKKEGLSTYSLAYTGALIALVGGVANIVPAAMDKSMKCVMADVALIAVGLYGTNVFLKKAGVLEGY